MWIPVGVEYTTTVGGATLKLVTCDHCRVEYCYVMQRSGSGSDTSVLFLSNQEARAYSQSAAEQELRLALRDGFDAVPCPQCGRYQLHMLKTVNRQRFARQYTLGKWLLLGCAALLLASLLAKALGEWVGAVALLVLAVVAGGLGAACMLTYYHAIEGTDPNLGDDEDRLRTAKERAVFKHLLLKANHPALDLASTCERLYPQLRALLAQWHPSAQALASPEAASREMRVLVQKMVAEEPLPLSDKERQDVIDMLMHKALPNRGVSDS